MLKKIRYSKLKLCVGGEGGGGGGMAGGKVGEEGRRGKGWEGYGITAPQFQHGISSFCQNF